MVPSSVACACDEGVRPGAVPGILHVICGLLWGGGEAHHISRYGCARNNGIVHTSPRAAWASRLSGVYGCLHALRSLRGINLQFSMRRPMSLRGPLPLDTPCPVAAYAGRSSRHGPPSPMQKMCALAVLHSWHGVSHPRKAFIGEQRTSDGLERRKEIHTNQPPKCMHCELLGISWISDRAC